MEKFECPQCKGSGHVDCEVWVFGSEEPSVSRLTCPTCRGEREITREALDHYRLENEMWCECEEPCENPDYFADGAHPEIRHHHWRCSRCRKVVQIG